MNLPNGHLLQKGKYRLTHVVGQGGFGITYKGVWFTEVKGSLGTVKTEVPIAIKEYFFKDYCYREEGSLAVKVHSETGKNIFDKFKEKLIHEARILSDVHHPNIVNVLEVFEENNTAYIAMEYISGLSLKEMMEREGVLPEAKVLKYVHQIGEALQFVHDNNILHLDIKPSNILIDRRDNARLIDFGVSKRYDTPHQETSTTMLTLSKGFASIEQYDNEGTQSFSPYPDVYSLGATMYNLLTGKIPTESILRATRPLALPTDLNPEISAKTEKVIIKAMEVVPTDRYQTVKEMMDELDPPPEEKALPDDKPDEYSRFFSSAAGDTTLIYPLGNSKLPIEDESEQTLLNDPVEEPLPVERKYGKVYALLLSVLLVLTLSAFALVFFSNKGKTVAQEETKTELPELNPSQTIPELDTSDERQTAQPTEEPGETETQPNEQTENREPVNTPQPNTTVPVNEPVVSRTEEPEPDLNATLDSLIASGREKMQREEFKAAEADFLKARELSPADHLLGMVINEAASKAKEKEIAERKALYEERMPLGSLIVVRQKSSLRFGAINAEALEVIPCKYLSAERAEEGLAFVREDDLFDIYNSEGKLVKESVASFN
ncbi:serine/threonine protein kinase [Parabacteroides sp. PF5-6]|uniref:serine/threonine protein kinase n=1 Tax=Parabacteroides sp. PF5-6 TaxID=1742403 RepID=UPI002405F0C4|nr:serine/threonine protein kinase [Parabacteroides sp. PF5-6]MDF9829610.1 serine/threonine protein kinase [Parabacteroides sp. PF5-6]